MLVLEHVQAKLIRKVLREQLVFMESITADANDCMSTDEDVARLEQNELEIEEIKLALSFL